MKNTMRNRRTFWGTVLILIGATSAFGDGGQLRVSQRCEQWQITVFTTPSPLRAGPVDISVLIQDAVTGRIVSQAEVMVKCARADDEHVPLWQPATHAAATNKLFYAATFELPQAGLWMVEIVAVMPGVTDPVTVGFEMEAETPLPLWRSQWPWFSWPVVVVLLFGVHRVLIARRESIGRRTLSSHTRALPLLNSSATSSSLHEISV